MVENSRRTITIVGLFALLLVLAFGVTYAAFSARVTGLENASVISLDGGEMWIDIDGGPDIVANNLIPDNDHPWVTKTITLTGKNNTGDLTMSYKINIVIDNNTFVTTPMVYTLESTNNSNNGGIIPSVENKTPINNITRLGSGYFNQGENLTHTYVLKIYFPDTGVDQSVDMRALYAAHIDINGTESSIVTNCTYDGELVAGAEYVNGQYTYHYLEEYTNANGWVSISNGWGVVLTDVVTNNGASTDPVTSPVCTFINGVPVTSASSMYYNSQAISIDLTKFNTGYITNMFTMFRGVVAPLDLSTLDTSNVTSMESLLNRYAGSSSVDLSSFDTSKVTNMQCMFCYSSLTSIDLLYLNTSNVTNMRNMFGNTNFSNLDFSSFDTSNVTDMTRMFAQSQMTTLDLSSFDTSKVTNMSDMFKQSQATSIDLSSFDTSNVTDMSGMFKLSTITNLNAGVFNSTSVTNVNNMFQEANLKGFTTFTMDGTNLTDLNNMFLAANLPSTVTIIITNTGNLTNMKAMFGNVTVTNLTLVIDTSNVTTMESLFSGISATTITISSFNTSKVTNMTTMFDRAPNLKNIYVSNLWNTSKVTKSSDMFNGDTKLKNYNSSYLDKTRAHYNTNGYLTYKANS